MSARDKAVAVIEKWTASPYVAASGFIAIAGTLLGLWQLLAGLPTLVAGITVAMILALLVLPGLIAFGFFSFHRLYHVPLTHRHINLSHEQRWHICADGHREIEATKSMLFLQPPRREDLSDAVFGSLEAGLAEVRYDSPDAKVVDWEQISTDFCRLYWKPKEGEVKVGKPYVHTMKCAYPPGDNAFNKSITVAAAVDTIGCRIIVTADHRIDEALAYRRRRFHTYRSFDEIYREAKKVRRSNSPAVARVGDRHVEWEIDRLRPGFVHCIVLRLVADHSARGNDTATLPQHSTARSTARSK